MTRKFIRGLTDLLIRESADKKIYERAGIYAEDLTKKRADKILIRELAEILTRKTERKLTIKQISPETSYKGWQETWQENCQAERKGLRN